MNFEYSTLNQFNGDDYTAREELKIEGTKQYTYALTMEDKFIGKSKIIYSHYCRSRQAAYLQNREHVETYEEYVGQWLYANAERLFEEDIKCVFSEKYAPYYPNAKNIRMQKGTSYFY